MAFKKTYSAQTALKTCEDHEHEGLHMYCKTCKKPICAVCVKRKHIHHDWDVMQKIAKALRTDSIRRTLEVESILKSMNRGTTDLLNHISSSNKERYTTNISDLESTRKAMHELVDSTIDAMKKKCQTHQNKISKAVEKKKREIQPKTERLQFLLSHIKEAATDYSDFDVIEFHDEVNELLSDLGSISVIPAEYQEEIMYKKEKLDKDVVTSMLGTVNTVTKSPSTMSVVPVSQFNCGEKEVNCICPISRNEAWVHCSRMTVNILINLNGQEKESFDIKCRPYNFILSNTGETILCDLDAKNVKYVDRSGKIKTMFSTEPLLPIMISVSRSGDFLVSLADEETWDRTNTSHRLVRRVTKTGTVIKEYEYDEDGKTPLFTWPVRPMELPNCNICIINEFIGEEGRVLGLLYGLDSCGVLKFKYSGVNNMFNPLDMCCNAMGDILVSDYYNKCVHLLDSEGKFVRFLLTEQTLEFGPYAIALFENQLWISSPDDGQVNVYSVLNE